MLIKKEKIEDLEFMECQNQLKIKLRCPNIWTSKKDRIKSL